MFQNLKQLYGNKLGATDGEIGEVKDFYFDDQSWAIRYLVVDTGSWLSGRQVLLTPHAFTTQNFGRADALEGVLSLNLSKNQIEGSPSIETHRPVSRQYELEYYRYYGWPSYWQDVGAWGVAGFPVVSTEPLPLEKQHHGHNQRDDIHLRSTKAVTGYEIRASDEALGTVSSFLVDEKSWLIRELELETGHWYSGKKILILPENVIRISYEESTVFVNLTKADIERTAKNELAEVKT